MMIRLIQSRKCLNIGVHWSPLESIEVHWSPLELEIVDDEDNIPFKLLVTIGAHWSQLELEMRMIMI